jgi:hypothetical protein
MEKTIFNVYVVMESQEQCNEMKSICIENGLGYWNDEIAFLYDIDNINYFSFSFNSSILNSLPLIDIKLLLKGLQIIKLACKAFLLQNWLILIT